MFRLHNLSFRNKILFSTLITMFLLSAGIALATRWVLVRNMTSELELRGIAIAQSIADLSRSYILTRDIPNLVSLAFDAAQLGERKPLIAYIFIVDTQSKLLAHTFTRPFPEELLDVNAVAPEQNHSVRLIHVFDNPAYDIAVPVREGIYQIGTIHVGLNKKHIDHLIAKLRLTFLGLISAIATIFVLIINWLSKYISKPIVQFTRMADEISRGNLDVQFDFPGASAGKTASSPGREKDLDEMHCEITCFAGAMRSGRTDAPPSPSGTRAGIPSEFLFRQPVGDEVVQLAEAFNNMIRSIKLYRSKLRESEEKYRSLFDSGPDPIFVLDRATFEILDANPSAERTYGYFREELLGKSFAELVPEHTEEILYNFHCREEPDEETLSISQKVRTYRKGGIPFYVNVHACPTIYRDRPAIIVATNDVTQMIEKDAQLVQASKMTALGEMSSGVAHELNQPLNSIKMGSEFLRMMIEKEGAVPPDQLHTVVDEMSSQVDRASEIISTLREFGRKAELVEERLNINRPIRGVFALLGQQLSLQNIHVVLELDDALPPILAHNNKLQQVLFNLVTNARDAINQKRQTVGNAVLQTIRIRSFMENDRVAVSVSDSGTGIPEHIRDKIFEPFFTTKEAGQGMGLGLSITYGIVRDYGGDIEVRSEEDVGTTFKLTFPVHPVPAEESRRR
jgi:histidine kinase